MFAHGKRSLFGWEVSLAGAPALPEGKERSPPSLVCPSLPVSIPFPVARGAREYLCGSERTQLMGSGKRVERRCLPRQALMMFSPFLWKERREGRILSSSYTHSSGMPHGRASPSWSPRLFLTRRRHYGCPPLPRFSCWLGSTTMQAVQHGWPVVGCKGDGSDFRSLGLSIAARFIHSRKRHEVHVLGKDREVQLTDD